MELLSLTIIGIISGVSAILGLFVGWSMSQDGLSAFSDEIDRLREHNERLSEENRELHSKLFIKIIEEEKRRQPKEPSSGDSISFHAFPPTIDGRTLPTGITHRKNGGFSVRIQRNGRRKSRVCTTLEEAKRVRENILRSLR